MAKTSARGLKGNRGHTADTFSDEHYVYGHVLEALTGGLYPNKLDVLREYVQNSYDAIKTYAQLGNDPAECEIRIYTKSNSVLVHDNATGMDLDTLQEYRKLGFSKKPYGQYAGWRGIGKAAGLAVAEKLIVTTQPIGGQECYQLEFRSSEMLEVLHEVRSRGENVPLDRLIQSYSSIESLEGDDGSHYTTVELCKIRSDSQELLDPNLLVEHLSQVSPVPFHPDFQHTIRISESLSEHIDDYLPVKISVNGDQVFKPYRAVWGPEDATIHLKEPEFLPIYDEGELVAFCWYCMNAGKGQIKTRIPVGANEIDISGLVYRISDIRIGDRQLVRKTAWTASPERAFYALGEIHILDPGIEPTSDRNDLQDSFARLRFYTLCNEMIASEINRKAHKQSGELRAEEKATLHLQSLKDLSSQMKSEKIPMELVQSAIYKATSAKEDLEKRKRFIVSRGTKKKASQVRKLADEVIGTVLPLTRPGASEAKVAETILDFPREMDLSEESAVIYSSVMRVLRDYFLSEPEVYEELVTRIQQDLRKSLERQGC